MIKKVEHILYNDIERLPLIALLATADNIASGDTYSNINSAELIKLKPAFLTRLDKISEVKLAAEKKTKIELSNSASIDPRLPDQSEIMKTKENNKHLQSLAAERLMLNTALQWISLQVDLPTGKY